MSYTEDIVPQMTGNTSPSGEAFSNIFLSTYYPWKAFDNSLSTSFYLTTQNGPWWIGYRFTEQHIITKYSYLPMADMRNAKTWEFQGSNNGVDWTVLDTQINVISWELNVKKEFTFINNTPFTYYRLYITSTTDLNNHYIAGEEIEMMESIPITFIPQVVLF